MKDKNLLPELAVDDLENTPEDTTINQAVSVSQASEQLGISLTVEEIAIHQGWQEPNRRQRIGEALKSHVPESLKNHGHFLTISEKIGRIAVAVSETASDQPTATEHFTQDKSFWEHMKVTNAWDAHVFEQRHFTHTDIDLFARKPPVEIGWLRAADIQIFTELQNLQREHNLRLRMLTKTPNAVLDSANSIAEDTQKTFMHTWLPHYLHAGQEPIMSDKEREQHDYQDDLETIDTFRQRALRIEADDELGEDEYEVLNKSNQLLTEGLAGEYVLQQLLHDHAARESESLRRMLPMLVLLSGAAWGVQSYAPNDAIRALAKVAGSGDDIVAEGMSLPRLKLSKEKLWRRMAWFAPLAAGMMIADAFVDTVDRSVNPHLGGAMYGATTVGLSAASSIGSLTEHKSRYRELIAEGKVREEHQVKPGKSAREHYIWNDPLRRGIIAGVIAGPLISATVWPWVEDKPYIYVPLGAIEPIAATISSKIDEKRLPYQRQKYTRQQTATLNAESTSKQTTG